MLLSLFFYNSFFSSGDELGVQTLRRKGNLKFILWHLFLDHAWLAYFYLYFQSIFF